MQVFYLIPFPKTAQILFVEFGSLGLRGGNLLLVEYLGIGKFRAGNLLFDYFWDLYRLISGPPDYARRGPDIWAFIHRSHPFVWCSTSVTESNHAQYRCQFHRVAASNL